MTLSIIPDAVKRLLDLKGQIVTLRTIKPCKVRKGEETVLKDSTFQARIGCNYDNLKAVQEKREDGTLPAENAGLPWGEWAVFPYLITHKGAFYLRCTAMKGGNPTVKTFHRNGSQIAEADARAACLASEFASKDLDVFDIKVDNIVEVNGAIV